MRRYLEGRKVLLGITGSIAAYKAAYLARSLVKAGASVTPVMTSSATRFVAPLTFEALCSTLCLTDDDMFGQGGYIRHVRLAHESEVIVIAPATANTIAKIACGIADNLITATVLASRCPVLLVPAMHSEMWTNEVTKRNVATLSKRFVVLEPPVGDLASGDIGPGRFADIEDIMDEVAALLSPRDLKGYRVLVTAGPTRERIDPVRFISNPSSGRMGIALAKMAAIRGADVTLILGPTEVPVPRVGGRIEVVKVETTAEMFEAVRSHLSSADALLMAAAPADQRPKKAYAQKVPKEDLPGQLDLELTEDILSYVSSCGTKAVVLGFAAETEEVEARGRQKALKKGCDLLFANPVGQGKGFGSAENGGILIHKDGTAKKIEPMPKEELADVLLDHVLDLLRGRHGRAQV